MDIVEFLQHCAGKWFSQRAGQDVVGREAAVTKGELWIDWLAPESSATAELCQRYGVEAGRAIAGLSLRWEDNTTLNKKITGSTQVVALGAKGDQIGALLASTGAGQPGEYAIGTDGALTLRLPIADGGHIEERIWFASENLRFRSSTVTRPNGLTATAFCSEIRLGVKAPAE